MKMNIKSKWIKALRGKKYKQGRGSLVNRSMDRHCCLGVLCDLYAKEHDVEIISKSDLVKKLGQCKEDSFPTKKVLTWAGLHHSTCENLAELNDKKSTTFNIVADYIEKKL